MNFKCFNPQILYSAHRSVVETMQRMFEQHTIEKHMHKSDIHSNKCVTCGSGFPGEKRCAAYILPACQTPRIFLND